MLTNILERPIEAGEGDGKQGGKGTAYVFEGAHAAYTRGVKDAVSRTLGSRGLQESVGDQGSMR